MEPQRRSLDLDWGTVSYREWRPDAATSPVTCCSAMPDACLHVVTDAGHWVQRDRPAIVTPAVIEFLEELD